MGQLLLIIGGLLCFYTLLIRLNSIDERIQQMADMEAQAIADLQAAGAAAVAMIQKLAADLAAAQAAAGTPPVDHSADIEAVVKALNDAVAPPAAPAA